MSCPEPDLQIGAAVEDALADRAAKGDVEAREQIAQACLPLVSTIAKTFLGRGLDYDDLVGEGCVGLTKAINAFCAPGCFRALATVTIAGAIRNAIYRSRCPVLPRFLIRRLRDWHRAGAELEAQLGRPPTVGEIARRLGLSRKKRRFLMRVRHTVKARTVSNADTVACSSPSVLDRITASEEAARVKSAFRRLEKYQRTLLGRRFGLDGGPAQSLERIAAFSNGSPATVRRFELLALEAMRDMLLDAPLKETRRQRRARQFAHLRAPSAP